jgi:hypothetical protein
LLKTTVPTSRLEIVFRHWQDHIALKKVMFSSASKDKWLKLWIKYLYIKTGNVLLYLNSFQYNMILKLTLYNCLCSFLLSRFVLKVNCSIFSGLYLSHIPNKPQFPQLEPCAFCESNFMKFPSSETIPCRHSSRYRSIIRQRHKPLKTLFKSWQPSMSTERSLTNFIATKCLNS